MQRVQRQFGKFMKRSADESQVAVLLNDYNEVDQLLGKIIESSGAWRDAWSSLLTYQSQLVEGFEKLYAPIIGSSEAPGHEAVETPEETMLRTSKLREEYEDLRKELLHEVYAVDERMIRPATQAKDFMAPLKKTIKKREDKKLDFERIQNKHDNYSQKAKRSDRDNASLAKAEADLAKANQEYNDADDHIRSTLPPLIAAVFSLLPRLLATQVEIQNSLLANYYTVLVNYSQAERFPSAPEMEDIVQQWELDHLPIQQQVETFGCIANSKARRQSTDPGNLRQENGSSLSVNSNNLSVNGRPPTQASNYRRPSSQSSYRPPSSHSNYHRPSTPNPATISESEPPSPGANTPPAPPLTTKPKPRLNDFQFPSSSNSNLTVPTPSTHAPSPSESLASARSDYGFPSTRKPSTPSTPSGFTTELSSVIANKKKPPPPPPSKPASLGNPAIYVTAVYDFVGEAAGDLSFREGDRIKVMKKTDSTDDWWEGQLRGVKGSFPANYVE